MKKPLVLLLTCTGMAFGQINLGEPGPFISWGSCGLSGDAGFTFTVTATAPVTIDTVDIIIPDESWRPYTKADAEEIVASLTYLLKFSDQQLKAEERVLRLGEEYVANSMLQEDIETLRRNRALVEQMRKDHAAAQLLLAKWRKRLQEME